MIFTLGLLLFAEIAVMVAIIRFFGIFTAVAIIITTAVVGVLVLLGLGPAVARRLRASLASSIVPEAGVLHTILLFLAGVLLITPGIIADIFGIALLFPCFRSIATDKARKLAEKLVNRGNLRIIHKNQR